MRKDFSEDELQQRIRKLVGEGVAAGLLMLEILMWYYVLLVRRDTEIEFAGEQYFSYHEKDGNAGNQFAFIIIMFEIPLAHLLLHFVWSPLGALIITIITAYGLLWMMGNYRATIKLVILDVIKDGGDKAFQRRKEYYRHMGFEGFRDSPERMFITLGVTTRSPEPDRLGCRSW